ncbi:hypothetical protein D7X55_30000 [Corallococcus sp. AB049A]|nr:hypothetical protein D7X55_30000 [Corallococcus sp. AB049A]
MGQTCLSWRACPVPIPCRGSDMSTVRGPGGSHTLALQSDGTVWAWGLNGQGQLCTGNAGYRVVPYQVSPTP